MKNAAEAGSSIPMVVLVSLLANYHTNNSGDDGGELCVGFTLQVCVFYSTEE